jgi:hypothetical protein
MIIKVSWPRQGEISQMPGPISHTRLAYYI